MSDIKLESMRGVAILHSLVPLSTSIYKELEHLQLDKRMTQVQLPPEVSSLASYITCGIEELHSMETYSDRPFFRYRVVGERVYAYCSSFSALAKDLSSNVLNTVTTFHSVADVYDRYGLDVAYSFIRILYSSILDLECSIERIFPYLLSSLAVLDIQGAKRIQS